MHCLFCKHSDTEVMETRVAEDGTTVRRRRQCPHCNKRFTTYERVEELPILAIKKDGRRERFDREKLRRGILKAVGKPTVTANQVDQIVDTVESEIKQKETTEIDTQAVGNLVAKELKKIDKIAYIRFASVFRQFVDLDDFKKELKRL